MEDNNSLINIDSIDLITIVFVVLKLTEVIDWSWWWVLSPILISFSLLIIALIIVLIIVLVNKLKDN